MNASFDSEEHVFARLNYVGVLFSLHAAAQSKPWSSSQSSLHLHLLRIVKALVNRIGDRRLPPLHLQTPLAHIDLSEIISTVRNFSNDYAKGAATAGGHAEDEAKPGSGPRAFSAARSGAAAARWGPSHATASLQMSTSHSSFSDLGFY